MSQTIRPPQDAPTAQAVAVALLNAAPEATVTVEAPIGFAEARASVPWLTVVGPV